VPLYDRIRLAEDLAVLDLASGDYLVVSPDECVALARETGSLLLHHPLMGGLDPDLAWESLELVASKVLPRLAEPA
jgi:hypothetical protein